MVTLEFSDTSISTVPPDPPSTAGRLVAMLGALRC